MSGPARVRFRTTQVVQGISRLSGWLLDRCESGAALVVDANLVAAPITARVAGSIGWAGRRADLVVRGAPADSRSVGELAALLSGAEAVVAVGGGSLLDEVKLAALMPANPTLPARLAAAHRSGVVLLPPDAEPAFPVAAVPTTLGTGSEQSGVACLASSAGKRLVLGAGLQPELAVLDPLATQTLPWELLAEGTLEVFFRVTGMYVGDHADLPTEDAFAEALLCRLVRLGNELAEVRAAGGRADGPRRLEIAKLSGLSHAGWLNHARDPFACRGWYLANELSSRLGLRKVTAAAALLPHLWEAVGADARWGSARRLDQLWRTLRAADAGRFPRDPAQGVAALIDHWQVERRVCADLPRVRQIAQDTARAWGRGLPALGGLTAADVEGMLARSVHLPVAGVRAP